MSLETKKPSALDEGKGARAEDWLATTVEVQELAAATPAVAPHSCSHCKEWELDLVHNTFNHTAHKDHEQTPADFTLAYVREKAELGCLFFDKILHMELRTQFPVSRSDGISDGAVLSVSPATMDSNPRVNVTWKNGKTIEADRTYEIYMPHGMSQHPPYTVNQDADKTRYAPLDWHFIGTFSAESGTQLEPKLSKGKELDRRLQLKPHQVFIPA